MVPTRLSNNRIRYILILYYVKEINQQYEAIITTKNFFILGILDSYINHRVHTILGRVTYSVFLMNTLSLITLTASLRTPVYYSYKMIVSIKNYYFYCEKILHYTVFIYCLLNTLNHIDMNFSFWSWNAEINNFSNTLHYPCKFRFLLFKSSPT